MSIKFQKVLNIKETLLAFWMVFTTPIVALVYDLNENLSIEGTLTGVYQHGNFDIEGMDDKGRGAGVLNLGVNFHPTDSDEFQITLSYAAGI